MDIFYYLDLLSDRLKRAEASLRDGKGTCLRTAFSEAEKLFRDLRVSERKAIFIGNGGSAAIASHMAVDFWKNAGIRAISFNDPSQLTCLSNDEGYENVFSIPITFFAEPGDLIIAISSSGMSRNILNAVDAASDKNCRSITLSGFRQDNPLKAKGDINFFIDHCSYGIVESAHAVICHYMLDTLLKRQPDA